MSRLLIKLYSSQTAQGSWERVNLIVMVFAEQGWIFVGGWFCCWGWEMRKDCCLGGNFCMHIVTISFLDCPLVVHMLLWLTDCCIHIVTIAHIVSQLLIFVRIVPQSQICCLNILSSLPFCCPCIAAIAYSLLCCICCPHSVFINLVPCRPIAIKACCYYPHFTTLLYVHYY